MAKKKVNKKTTSKPKPVSENKINLDYIILFILDVLVIFSARIPLNLFRWITTMAVRGYIFYIYGVYYHNKLLDYLTLPDGHTSIWGLPVILFMLWYFFTTLLMFLAPFYHSPGSDSFLENETFDEIENFKQWRDNKMRFTDYKESTQLMRDTSVINNLDTKDPEARKTLSYINNKLRFMGYQEGLEFLRGDKK